MNLIIKGDKIPDGVSPADDDPHLFTTIWEKESTAAVIVLWQKSEERHAGPQRSGSQISLRPKPEIPVVEKLPDSPKGFLR